MWFPPPFIVFSFPFSFCASGWIFSPDLYSSSQILSSAMFKLMLNLLWGSYCQSSHSIHFFCCFIYFWNYPSCHQFLSILKVILKSMFDISDLCISVVLFPFFVFPLFWLFGLLVCLVFLMVCWTVNMKTVEIWGCWWWYLPLEDFHISPLGYGHMLQSN